MKFYQEMYRLEGTFFMEQMTKCNTANLPFLFAL